MSLVCGNCGLDWASAFGAGQAGAPVQTICCGSIPPCGWCGRNQWIFTQAPTAVTAVPPASGLPPPSSGIVVSGVLCIPPGVPPVVLCGAPMINAPTGNIPVGAGIPSSGGRYGQPAQVRSLVKPLVDAAPVQSAPKENPFYTGKYNW